MWAVMEMSFKCRSTATLDGGSWLHEFSFDPKIVIVPLVHDKSGRLKDTLFETNCQNFDCGSESNKALFLGKNVKLLIVAKNHFQRYIICLYLESFAQNIIFRDN